VLISSLLILYTNLQGQIAARLICCQTPAAENNEAASYPYRVEYIHTYIHTRECMAPKLPIEESVSKSMHQSFYIHHKLLETGNPSAVPLQETAQNPDMTNIGRRAFYDAV
jgi:hypothetical protein